MIFTIYAFATPREFRCLAYDFLGPTNKCISICEFNLTSTFVTSQILFSVPLVLFFLFCCWCSIESEKVEQVKWSKVKQFHSKIKGGTQWIKVGKNKEYNRGEKKYPNEKGKQWVSDEFFCVLSRKYMKWVMEWHTFLLTSRIMFHISCVHFSF